MDEFRFSDGLAEKVIDELQELAFEFEVGSRIIERKLLSVQEALIADAEARPSAPGDLLEPGDDDLLSLKQALCLPELGGVLRRNLEDSTPSTTVFRKTLYKAIGRGLLVVTKFNQTEFGVNRREIRAWLERCTVPREVAHVPVRRAGRRSKSAAATTMPEAKMAKAAVEFMLDKMKKGN